MDTVILLAVRTREVRSLSRAKEASLVLSLEDCAVERPTVSHRYRIVSYITVMALRRRHYDFLLANKGEIAA